MNEWGFNPQTLSVVISFILLVNVGFGLRQVQIAVGRLHAASAHLRSAESARRAQLLFHVWDKYEAAHTLEDVRNLSEMLKKERPTTIAEFNEAEKKFKQLKDKGDFNAHHARRLIKFILAPLGYLLKHEIATPEELFPVVPAAIRLWGLGLRDIELQLLNHSGGTREFELGYDPVSLVDYLHQEYCKRVDKGK